MWEGPSPSKCGRISMVKKDAEKPLSMDISIWFYIYIYIYMFTWNFRTVAGVEFEWVDICSHFVGSVHRISPYCNSAFDIISFVSVNVFSYFPMALKHGFKLKIVNVLIFNYIIINGSQPISSSGKWQVLQWETYLIPELLEEHGQTPKWIHIPRYMLWKTQPRNTKKNKRNLQKQRITTNTEPNSIQFRHSLVFMNHFSLNDNNLLIESAANYLLNKANHKSLTRLSWLHMAITFNQLSVQTSPLPCKSPRLHPTWPGDRCCKAAAAPSSKGWLAALQGLVTVYPSTVQPAPFEQIWLESHELVNHQSSSIAV